MGKYDSHSTVQKWWIPPSYNQLFGGQNRILGFWDTICSDKSIDSKRKSSGLFLEVIPIDKRTAVAGHCILYEAFLKWGYPNSWMVYHGQSHLEMDDN